MEFYGKKKNNFKRVEHRMNKEIRKNRERQARSDAWNRYIQQSEEIVNDTLLDLRLHKWFNIIILVFIGCAVLPKFLGGY